MSQAQSLRRPAAVWPTRTHWAGLVPQDAAAATLLGRLVDWSDGQGRLADESGQVAVRCAPAAAAPVCAGDVVVATGKLRSYVLEAARIEPLAPGAGTLAAASDWCRFAERGGLRARQLRIRAQVLASIRAFFAARSFLEVETPVFVTGTGQESHLEFFRTEYRAPGVCLPGVLIPSPEHHMKRLLGAGFERIYQLVRCFRNGETSPRHNPEFTMLEWYRAYASYFEVMRDAEDLTRAVVGDVRGAPVATLAGSTIDLGKPWPRLSVAEAFRRHAGVPLRECLDRDGLHRAAAAAGCRSVTAADTWEDAFHKLLIERVEPALQACGACFLVDYPVAVGALARRRPDDPEWVERAEAYVGGMELANGFSELNDAVEQRRRFAQEQERRRAAGSAPLATDEPFLRMLEGGMPPAGGMALGVDRLVMLCGGAVSLGEVIAFPLAGKDGDGSGAVGPSGRSPD